jgi:hypothetical protein
MRIITTLLLLTCSTFGLAQYRELGAFIGATNYKGDLHQESALVPTEYNPALGLFGRYNFSRTLAAKVSLTKGQITGMDANSKDPAIRNRNLNFRSDVVELSLQGEFNLLPFAIREGKTSAPYLFAGLAGYYFNPQAEMRGNWYDLQPLGTEGQGMTNKARYSRYQVAIPFGIGFKFSLNNQINLGMEFGARRTFTDYLDDVSGLYPDILELEQVNPRAAALSFRTPEVNHHAPSNPEGLYRGNPDDKDWYFFGGITMSVNMTDKYGLDFDKKYDIFKTPKTDDSEVNKRWLKRKAQMQKAREHRKAIAAKKKK